MSPKNIKELRIDLGLTQEQMAHALGIAKLTMSQYETGFRKPGPTVLILLAVLDSIHRKRALELIEMLDNAAKTLGLERKRSQK